MAQSHKSSTLQAGPIFEFRTVVLVASIHQPGKLSLRPHLVRSQGTCPSGQLLLAAPAPVWVELARPVTCGHLQLPGACEAGAPVTADILRPSPEQGFQGHRGAEQGLCPLGLMKIHGNLGELEWG